MRERKKPLPSRPIVVVSLQDVAGNRVRHVGRHGALRRLWPISLHKPASILKSSAEVGQDVPWVTVAGHYVGAPEQCPDRAVTCRTLKMPKYLIIRYPVNCCGPHGHFL